MLYVLPPATSYVTGLLGFIFHGSLCGLLWLSALFAIPLDENLKYVYDEDPQYRRQIHRDRLPPLLHRPFHCPGHSSHGRTCVHEKGSQFNEPEFDSLGSELGSSWRLLLLIILIRNTLGFPPTTITPPSLSVLRFHSQYFPVQYFPAQCFPAQCLSSNHLALPLVEYSLVDSELMFPNQVLVIRLVGRRFRRGSSIRTTQVSSP